MAVTLFDRFVKNMTEEGVEINKNTAATSALINSCVKNVENKTARQVHSQCSHTNFKECRKHEDANLDNMLLEKLAENRAAMRNKR